MLHISCVSLCITTHFFVNERVDALYAIIIKGASLCISMQDLVLFSSWCNFLRVKMHCVQKPCLYNPKYLSKKFCIFSMTVFFFSCLLPPPNLDIGGSILSMSVPVVLTCPSLKLLSMNFSVSSGFRFSLLNRKQTTKQEMQM